jgi:hypothetical protein
MQPIGPDGSNTCTMLIYRTHKYSSWFLISTRRTRNLSIVSIPVSLSLSDAKFACAGCLSSPRHISSCGPHATSHRADEARRAECRLFDNSGSKHDNQCMPTRLPSPTDCNCPNHRVDIWQALAWVCSRWPVSTQELGISSPPSGRWSRSSGLALTAAGHRATSLLGRQRRRQLPVIELTAAAAAARQTHFTAHTAT